MQKSDANANAIVSVLRQAGCAVVFVQGQFVSGVPDVLVSRNGQTWLMEIKVKGGRLSPAQKLFIEGWKAPVAVVRSPEEALAVVGLM
jgi:Holliday junction resolvase